MASAELGKLRIDDFSKQLSSTFETKAADGNVVPLQLVEVTPHVQSTPATAKSDKGEELKTRDGGGFSLQFVAPQGPWLPQGIYPVKHPTLGTLEIFIVPSGPLHQGHGYHAVFG